MHYQTISSDYEREQNASNRTTLRGSFYIKIYPPHGVISNSLHCFEVPWSPDPLLVLIARYSGRDSYYKLVSNIIVERLSKVPSARHTSHYIYHQEEHNGHETANALEL